MHITDPIADMLARIRNANSAKHDTVDIPASKMKKAIAQILVDEGYIKAYKIIDDDKQGVIRVTLKYGEGKSQVITGLRRVSKPGLRIYSNVEDMPKVMKGLGVAIISTSKGIMTDREARKQNVGGEVLAFIWLGRCSRMSRIGLKPIVIPAGVDVTLDGNTVTVKGPNGTLTMDKAPVIGVKVEGNEINVSRPNDEKDRKSTRLNSSHERIS